MSLDPGQDLDKLTTFPKGSCDRCERRFPLATAPQAERWQPACAPWPAKRGAEPGAWFCCEKCCMEAKADADASGWTAEELAKFRASCSLRRPSPGRLSVLAMMAGIGAFASLPRRGNHDR